MFAKKCADTMPILCRLLCRPLCRWRVPFKNFVPAFGHSRKVVWAYANGCSGVRKRLETASFAPAKMLFEPRRDALHTPSRRSFRPRRTPLSTRKSTAFLQEQCFSLKVRQKGSKKVAGLKRYSATVICLVIRRLPQKVAR